MWLRVSHLVFSLPRSAAGLADSAAMLRSLSAAAARRRGLCSSSSAASVKASLTLPRTQFPLHITHAEVETALAPTLAHAHYARQAELRASAQPFVLHDGPPYANGDLHLGHFLNKTLKDMINRWMLLRGRRVDFTPGWDCHGLPIELRALQLAGAESAHALPALEIRSRAAACAKEAVDAQRASFVRWGIMADWDRPYTTMQPSYEAAQLGVLQSMLAKGLVFRGSRPVHWSPATRTALAEAELDYVDEHQSQAAYVGFRVLPPGDGRSLEGLGGLPLAGTGDVSLVIWTTTPWTLPSNQAVCARGDLVYALVEAAPNQHLLVAEATVEHVSAALGVSLKVRGTVTGRDLDGLQCAHPLSGRPVPVLFGDHVTDAAGTGLVHTAPAHGPEDFAVGREHGLSTECPVDETGCFTAAVDEAAPFAGLNVLSDGNDAVLDALRRRGALLAASPYTHRYPYDWRSKTPVIFRTTPQWFVELSTLREEALSALDSVTMQPPSGRSRLEAFVRGRAEWCLSRQRSWGVPLPAFYDRETGEALLTDETVAHVRSLVERSGAGCWWELDEAALLPPRLQAEASRWRKGTDTLDVWFDSGASWSAVLAPREPAAPRADVYLEGSDQHRGWFQSSLLTHVGASEGGGAPYGAIVTHGFVVDERGAKMSKSIGNVITPAQLISEGLPSQPGPTAAAAAAAAATAAEANAAPGSGGAPKKAGGKSKKARREARQAGAKQAPFGVDVLRLWVATSDWASDVAVGETVLMHSREAYRRLRNSCRFMLGNLHDFDASKDAVPFGELRQRDRYMLHQLAEFTRAVERGHDQHALNRVVASALSLSSEALSADYFDATKDRLYCAQQDGTSRRAVQTVLHAALDTLLLAIGPITPFLAEEVHAHRAAPRPPPPIERTWQPPPAEWHQPALARRMQLAGALRTEVAKLIHEAHTAKELKGASEALVEIRPSDGSGELHRALVELGAELNDVLGVCATKVVGSADGGGAREGGAALGVFEGTIAPPSGEAALGVSLALHRTSGEKCDRCWRYVPDAAPKGAEGVRIDGDDWLYRGCVCYT